MICQYSTKTTLFLIPASCKEITNEELSDKYREVLLQCGCGVFLTTTDFKDAISYDEMSKNPGKYEKDYSICDANPIEQKNIHAGSNDSP